MKLIPLILVILLSACGKVSKQKSSTKQQDSSPYYQAQTLKMKVYYEPGAEPYTQDLIIQYWNLLESNLKALFSGRSIEPTLSIPKNLSDMTALPVSGDTSWSINDVLNLAKKHSTGGDSTTFEIYFVNGHASESNGIIGFHINDTRIIVIFKDVIKATGPGNHEAVPKYVEQATLIHEMGHALGLVNNGVKMVEDHHDKTNGAHCSNANCVMYYQNEGSSGLINFAKKVIETGDTVMFDDKCLKDTRSF